MILIVFGKNERKIAETSLNCIAFLVRNDKLTNKDEIWLLADAAGTPDTLIITDDDHVPFQNMTYQPIKHYGPVRKSENLVFREGKLTLEGFVRTGSTLVL